MRNRTSHTYGDPHRWMVFASKLNMLIPVGVIIGAPFFGWLTDRFSLNKRNILTVILTLYTLAWVGVTFFSSQLWTVGRSLPAVGIQERFFDLPVRHRRLSGAVVLPQAEPPVPSLKLSRRHPL